MRALTEGTDFHGYRVLGLLGQGGMAEVYLALGPQGPVVLKRLRPELAREAEYVAMFRQEARVMKLLQHPNCIRVLAGVEHGEDRALVVELLDGRNLQQVLHAVQARKEAIPVGLVVSIMASALEALQHAHTLTQENGKPLKLVHRDISPENVIVTFDGVVKLLDFGIARSEMQEVRTGTGVIKGKPSYVSPEAIEGLKLDARADIFSMGVTLYELLTHQRPYTGKTAVEVLEAIGAGKIKPIHAANPKVPAPLAAVAMKALEHDRHKRYPSAQAMRAALLEGTGGIPGALELAEFLERFFPAQRDADRRKLATLLGSKAPDGSSLPPPLPAEALDDHATLKLPRHLVQAEARAQAKGARVPATDDVVTVAVSTGMVAAVLAEDDDPVFASG